MPETSLVHAKLCLLDTLGVGIAAHPMEAGRITREAALRLYGTSIAADQAPLMLDGRMASRAGAAFALATQTDNLDAHDGFAPTKGHIGCAVVPALLAAAHGMTGLSGRDALAAVVIGYEVAGRTGVSLHATVSDYHTSGAWNALGVVALAARLWGMGADQLREALGIAEYHGPRSQMMREIANPTMLHDGSGMGALVGLSAVAMAEMGFTGAPAITVEGDEVAGHWTDLGQRWTMEEQYIKPYPICRWAHAPIDAMQALRAAHRFGAGDIERIEIQSFHNAVQLFPVMPATTSEAQYSLPFAVAVMAAYGSISLDRISGEGLSDPLVTDLVGRTGMSAAQRHEDRFPAGRWADVAVTLRDGTTLQSEDTNARGGPDGPLSEAEIREKFLSYAAPVLGDERARRVEAAVLSLDEDGARFEAVSDLLIAPP